MKRFPAREALVLCLPALALLAVPLFLSSLQPQHNAIRVVAARTASPVPSNVEMGADVAALLELNDLPDENFPAKWKVAVRLVAGNHLLWNDKKGNGERDVMRGGRTTSGAHYQWEGAFDLDKVPASWGEVAIKWDAELVQERRFWLRSYQHVSRRNGDFVLRRAGEKLTPPKVSRDSHLKLLRVEIGAPKTIENGATLSYPIRFYFERDAFSRQTAPRIDCDYEVRPRDGFMTFTSRNGGEDNSRWYEGDIPFADSKIVKVRRFPVLTHSIDVESKSSLPAQSWVDWIFSHGDFWPLRVTIPFSDARGRVLIGTRRLKSN